MIFHSSFEYSYLWLPLIGFIIGVLASLIGSGGSFFFLLTLLLLFEVSAPIAVTTSLAATLPICIVGTAGHYRHGHINLRLGLLFIAAGVPGALLGANFTGLLPPDKLKIAFGIYVIVLALHMLINYFRRKKSEKNSQYTPEKNSGKRKTAKGSIFGLLAGIITGTFGTSGAAPVLAGLLSMQIPVKQVAGTSLSIILVNTLFALTAHFLVGKIDLMLVYFLATGATIGAFTGPKILADFKTGGTEDFLRLSYAIVLVILGFVMIFSK